MDGAEKKAVMQAGNLTAASFMDAYRKADNRLSMRRADFDKIGRYVAPSRLPEPWRETPDAPLTHDLVDTTAVSANQRLSSMLCLYVFPMNEHWSVPRLEGREPTGDERRWLDGVQDDLHDWFTYRSSSFQKAKPEILAELCAFGNGPSYLWSKPFGLPEYKALSIYNSRFLLDHMGKVTHFFWDVDMSLNEIKAAFPDAVLKDSKDNNAVDQKVIYGVVPNTGAGRPYVERVMLSMGDVVLREKPMKEMPFYVPAFARRPQDHYGIGPGHLAMPFAKWLNRIQESAVDGAEMSVRPPTFDFTGGIISKKDLRPGAYNQATFSAMNIMSVAEALQRFEPSGDLRPGIEMVRDARQTINMAFYVDWLQSNDAGVRTATEVSDMRSMRFQSLATLVSNIVPDWVTPMVERTFRMLLEADYFAPMPPSLRGEAVSFEYRSPLASLINQVQTEKIMNYLRKMGELAQLDPQVMDNVDMDAAARRIHKTDGVPADVLRDADQVEATREGRRKAAEQQAQQEALQANAAALRDGGQGAAALMGAQQDG